MAKEIYVHAGWTDDQEVIGVCHFDFLNGEETVSFEYDEIWMKNHPGFVLDPDLSYVQGRQYPASGKMVFGFLLDCAPDRWGRMLLDRREVRSSSLSGKAPRRLLLSDYLLDVSDFGRHGAIRFSDGFGRFYASESGPFPPIALIRELEDAARIVENASPERDDALSKIVDCGSSLGGARPKATILDTDGSMWIAKFPSRFDSMDSGAWEMVCNRLMYSCGIRVPEARLLRFSKYGSTFLTKRFDRVPNENGCDRIHTASAMALLGYTDDLSGASYLDLVELCESYSSSPNSDLKELWRRLVFNLCVTNTDDHLRNHSFLYDGTGWHFSPVYDVVPNPDSVMHSLTIDGKSVENRIENAISVSAFFRMSREIAVEEAEKIRKTVARHWFEKARRYGIGASEILRFSRCFPKA